MPLRAQKQVIDFLPGEPEKFPDTKTVEFLAELPKSGTGKILKRVLREKYWEHLQRRVGT